MSNEQQSVSRAELGKEVGFAAHELHNILTVFFGVVEEVQSDPSEVAVRNAPLLQAGVDKTEDVARSLFALRQRTLADQLVDGASEMRALAPAFPELGSVADALADAPNLVGDTALFHGWLLALLAGSRLAGGITAAALVPAEGATPGTTLRVQVTFGDAVSSDVAALADAACKSLGGSARAAENTLECDVLRQRNTG